MESPKATRPPASRDNDLSLTRRLPDPPLVHRRRRPRSRRPAHGACSATRASASLPGSSAVRRPWEAHHLDSRTRLAAHVALRERSWGDSSHFPSRAGERLPSLLPQTSRYLMPPNASSARLGGWPRCSGRSRGLVTPSPATRSCAPPAAPPRCHARDDRGARALDPATAVRIVDPGWLEYAWIQVWNGDVCVHAYDPASGSFTDMALVRHVRLAEGPGGTAAGEPLQSPRSTTAP